MLDVVEDDCWKGGDESTKLLVAELNSTSFSYNSEVEEYWFSLSGGVELFGVDDFSVVFMRNDTSEELGDISGVLGLILGGDSKILKSKSGGWFGESSVGNNFLFSKNHSSKSGKVVKDRFWEDVGP